MCGFVDLNNDASNCISCSFRAISRSQTSSVNEYWLSRAKALVLLVKHRNSFCSQLSERAESSLIHRYQVSKQTLQGIMCTRKECWDRPSLMSLSFLGRMCCLVEYFQGFGLWGYLHSSLHSYVCKSLHVTQNDTEYCTQFLSISIALTLYCFVYHIKKSLSSYNWL